MPGIENLLNYGAAQVLPKPESTMPLVEQLNLQKQQKWQREKYEQAKKEKDQNELYGLVGDALNLKDFNPVIHDRVRKAQVELAQKLKSEKPSYGDAYILAQNKAAELGVLSQSLNQADQVIAAQKKEWEGDKRINAGNLEMLARKDILDDLNKNGKIDPTVNYIEMAARKYPQYALTDSGEFAQFKFLPEETQKSITGKYKEINKRGGYDQFDWKVSEYAPSLYDFKDNGEEKAPTITTKSEPSGLVDADNNPVPMLSEQAWGRYSAVTSNIYDLDRRIKRKYGDAVDLQSQEAEILRRIEAYKEVEKNKPIISKSRIEKADPAPRISVSVNTGGNKDAGRDWVTRAQGAMKGGDKQTVTDVFSELIAGDITKFNGVEDLGGGKIKVKILPKQKYDIFGQAIQGATDPVEKTFDVNSRTLPYELQNLYQTIMGGDKKLEQTYFPPNTVGKQTTEYSQITETNKGKIGVKNGKWYYVDTGKPAQ